MNNSTPIRTRMTMALFAGAAVAALAAPAAHAAVVYVNRTATPLLIPNSIDGVYFNIVTGVTGSSGAQVPGWDINPYNNGAGLTLYGAASPQGILATGTPGTGAVATRLTFGATIGPSGQYNQFQTLGTAIQGVSGLSYIGLRFTNESTGAANYAWAEFQTTAGDGFPAALLRYAYENTGVAITAGSVGVVPEPSTFAMFGLALAGAAGFSAMRRRRQG
ncbi:MAG: PEP-CTERM sorting domain-containing protein [Rubrivivax sp.]